VPLGIVAAGSGNDYAWNTPKLPHDPALAIERAFTGQLIEVDAGVVNGEYFANAFAMGLDANIAVAAERLKRLPFMSGPRLYYSATLQELLFGYHRCPWLTLRLDADRPADEPKAWRYVVLAVTIGPTYGAGFRINPSADHRDGLFDVCAIAYTPLLRALKLLPIVQKGEHSSLPEVTFYRAKSISIEARQPVNMHTDGEIGRGTSYDARILPWALRVRV
jgi:diacylglycerol kinase (ATP)